MVHADKDRRLAIVALLAQPDPPDLQSRRAHRLRIPGKPDRFTQVPALSAAFI